MYVHSSRLAKLVSYQRNLGIDPRPLLKEVNLSDSALHEPDRTFPLELYLRFFEAAVRSSGDPLFGLHMGLEPHIAGTIGMMCASCETLKEAFVEGCTYFRMQGDFATIQFMDDPLHPRVRYALPDLWILGSPLTAKHEVESMFSFLTTILRVNSNGKFRPHAVHFTAPAPANRQEYREIFGKDPLFGQEFNEMVFLARNLLHPMKAFNPETRKVLRDYVVSQIRKFENTARISEKVRSVLLSSVQYSFPGIERVASRLNMSARTLQRMLSEEKTSFKEVLQETRMQLARELLARKDLTISEISYMIGYSELGNFSRSFKKCTGESPQLYRTKLTLLS